MPSAVDQLTSQFTLLQELASTALSHVALVANNSKQAFVLKISNVSKPHYRSVVLTECALLSHIKERYNKESSPFVQLHDAFRAHYSSFEKFFSSQREEHNSLTIETLIPRKAATQGEDDLVCLLMERLENTSAEWLDCKNCGRKCPFTEQELKGLLRDVLLSLKLLHRDMGVVHRDIKPGNIMSTIPKGDRSCNACPGNRAALASKQQDLTRLTEPYSKGGQEATPSTASTSHTYTWKLIDLGNACRLKARKNMPFQLQLPFQRTPPNTSVVEQSLDRVSTPLGVLSPSWCPMAGSAAQGDIIYDTPAYAPPEALLGLEVSPGYDMWSLGCVAYELATGIKLFPPRQSGRYDVSDHHMWMMVQLLGRPSHGLLKRAVHPDTHFNADSGRLWMEEEGLTMYYTNLAECLTADMQGKWNQKQVSELANFLRPLLEWDPRARPSSTELLAHPWLSLEA